MGLLQSFKARHPDLFAYQPSREVHLHDRLLEKLLLKFLPAKLTPNQVTLFRILFTPIVFVLILSGYYIVGGWLFLLVAFTDAIDGSLARTRGKITKFGMMFDPLADKLLIGSMVILLVFEYFNIFLGLAILGIEIIFMALALVSSYRFKTVRMANIWGKIKMVSQVSAVCLTLLAIFLASPVLLNIAAWIFGVGLRFPLISFFSHPI